MQTNDTDATTTLGPACCERCGAPDPGVLDETETGDLELICDECDEFEASGGDTTSAWEYVRGLVAPLFGGADDRRAER